MMSQKTNAADAKRHRAQQEHNSTDVKMNSFLDEMRQQFMQTQNVNVIPQSLMYRQTQLMESQVQMLEQNQKQMGEVINNVMNQASTGHESGASLKQNIFNENRRMMLEMMVPLNQQLGDMKLLYENTKTTSTQVESKIEELKKIMSMQMSSLHGASGSASSMPAAQPQMGGGMFSDAGVLDPTILQKGIATIKEQMKDVQREALMIETEMEKRFSDMINKNTSQRFLPKSLTEEIIEHKNTVNEHKLRQAIGEAGDTAAPEAQQQASKEAPACGYAQIRDAIQDRLGGPLDYAQFTADLRGETSDLAAIQREFKFQGQAC